MTLAGSSPLEQRCTSKFEATLEIILFVIEVFEHINGNMPMKYKYKYNGMHLILLHKNEELNYFVELQTYP